MKDNKPTTINLSKIIENTDAPDGVAKSTVGSIIKSFVSELAAAIDTHDTVRISGLGTIKSTLVPERNGRNPLTGESITIKEHTRYRFKKHGNK